MELYLVQHGEATSEQEDPERPLTAAGREAVERVARAAKAAGVRIRRVYHSGKLRARQTAEILARELGSGATPDVMDGLAPKDDPAVAGAALADLRDPAILVGHLPHLSRLASLLLLGDPDREIIAFRNGGIVCLCEEGDGSWKVGWILTPAVVRRET